MRYPMSEREKELWEICKPYLIHVKVFDKESYLECKHLKLRDDAPEEVKAVFPEFLEYVKKDWEYEFDPDFFG